MSCVSLTSANDDMECELRHLCAYNIPVSMQCQIILDNTGCAVIGILLPQAMVMFHGKEKFSRDLLQVLNRLVDDNNVKVRQSISYGIHEVLLCVL